MTSKESSQQAAPPPDCQSCELPLDSLVETLEQNRRHLFKQGRFMLFEVETDDRSWRCGRCGENLTEEAWKEVSRLMVAKKWRAPRAALRGRRESA